jgi:MerR family transcriptional regulator, light-induced transcriptional regulator
MPAALPETTPARLRSGTAARLAGLPVTTLRVWERRYAVVAASKTESGQRIYSHHDVSRLRLLRQLTHRGHPIGTIATLDLDALQALSGAPEATPPDALAVPRSVVVVGRSAAHRLEAVAECEIRAVYDDLDQAAARAHLGGRVDLLLVRLASLQPTSVERVLALAVALRAGAIIVIYAFGTDATTELLRAAGATVRHEPITSRELAQLVHATRRAPEPTDVGQHVAPRLFDDKALAALADMPSPIACECLRHLADIVTQLAGFERYSHDCVSTSPADTVLHRHLSRVAGSARTMFEQALQRVVIREGLELSDGPLD